MSDEETREERGMAWWSAEKVWVPFIGPEKRERRQSVQELGRRPLMVPFRVGEGMGRGNRESRR
jgi:hypothetical protein